jgi:hypothetical protein
VDAAIYLEAAAALIRLLVLCSRVKSRGPNRVDQGKNISQKTYWNNPNIPDLIRMSAKLCCAFTNNIDGV